MIIDALDILSNQRTALEEAPERRMDLYREKVVEPLRPFWETILARIPVGGEQPDPVQLMGLFDPAAESVQEGLKALSMLNRAGSWAACQEALVHAEQRLKPAEHGIHLDRLLFALILGSSLRFGKEPGYTGSGGMPGMVTVLVWPYDYNIPRLQAVTAHEFHHNVRLSYEPWSLETTVGQYLVVEGLAEAFAAEMYEEDKLGPWVHALNDSKHESLKPRYREALQVSGFNEIRSYIFGDLEEDYGFVKKGLPPYAGYAVGYRVVTEYLRRTGKSAVQATYVPWQEIVEESRYF